MAQAVASLAIGVFFGAALYISVVQHPAALATGSEFAARYFRLMYARASVLQAPLAVVGTSAAVATYFSTSDVMWLGIATLIGSVVPFTLLVIDRVNRELKAYVPDRPAERTRALLVRWSRLHWFRTFASGLAFLGCLYFVWTEAA